MKKNTLLIFTLALSLFANAQSTIFEDSFESYTNFAIANVGSWTLTDVDLGLTGGIQSTAVPPVPFVFANSGVAKSFQVFNPALTTPPLPGDGWNAKTGVQSMICFYKRSPTPLVNNDWLISPQITLGTSNTVKFWGKAASTEFANEKFSVYLSSTNTTVSSFTKISPGVSVTSPAPGAVWIEYTYTIPASYDNTQVFIGIQCVSEDRFAFLVDDFKVTGTVPCAAPSQLAAVVNTAALTVALTWTPGGALDSEVKVQLAGAGIPAVADNTGVAASGTYTTMPLMASTNYEFWVRDECTSGTLFSSWSGPFAFNTNSAPDCAVLVAPANAATAVSALAPVTLTWTAAATGAAATSYDLFFGTAAVPVTLAGNFTTLTTTRPIAATTTYYWKVVAKNAAGNAVGCTSVFSFTTAGSAFSPYCGPVAYADDLEPITYVNFAGIDKTYPNTVVTVPTAVHHKIFTDVATLPQGSTNVISLKGMTAGAFTNKFMVFIDWNQNGVLNDAGEVYFSTVPLTIGAPLTVGGTSVGSEGLPADAPVVGNIIVPATATLGNTRMRIKKMFTQPTAIPAGFDDPCISFPIGITYGEMHDYAVTVTPNLAADTFSSINFKSFPNPVKDVLNLSFDKNITNVAVINLLGQEVLSIKLDTKEAKIDMASLTTGAYMVKITADNEVKTIKVIKE